MPVTISHGTNKYGEEAFSATTIANLGQHLAHVLSSRDWRTVAFLFNGQLRGPVTVPPRKAGQVSAALGRAVGHPLMPRGVWTEYAQAFADAAQRAATARQPWEWS
ncbi:MULTISPECIES: hypothetical protein [Streptomyces]|uniref:DUF7739 domain-containing protein n=1 Tax=Streptomyces TaxID=1883 RepID=UPI000F7A5358|nr:hypothetical protein [Streptomyces sp. WAC05858]RSS45423.1 hypothetical protein EF902_14015 [Streptomyces sp. WAC05858]